MVGRTTNAPVDVDVIRHRIVDIENTIQELRRLVGREFRSLSLDEIYSMRYNVVILVEAVVSLATHILVEEFGYKPRSYVEAVEQLSLRLGVGCSEELKALVRLRNLLVHRYWAIDDGKVYDSIKRDFDCVRELIEVVRRRYGD